MKVLRVNRIIEVELPGRKRALKSKIEDIGPQTFLISRLFERGELVPVHRGDRLRITLTVEDGSPGEGTYQFESTVRGLRHDNVPLIELSRPEKYFRVQRREMYRLPIMMPVCYRFPVEDEWKTARIVDISGSGVRLVGDLPGRVDDQIDLLLDLDGLLLELRGEIVSTGILETNGRRWFGIKFLDMDYRTEDQIVRFIFNRQRKMRRRGIV